MVDISNTGVFYEAYEEVREAGRMFFPRQGGRVMGLLYRNRLCCGPPCSFMGKDHRVDDQASCLLAVELSALTWLHLIAASVSISRRVSWCAVCGKGWIFVCLS